MDLEVGMVQVIVSLVARHCPYARITVPQDVGIRHFVMRDADAVLEGWLDNSESTFQEQRSVRNNTHTNFYTNT